MNKLTLGKSELNIQSFKSQLVSRFKHKEEQYGRICKFQIFIFLEIFAIFPAEGKGALLSLKVMTIDLVLTP